MRRFQVYVNGQPFEVLVEEVGAQAPSFGPAVAAPQMMVQPAPMPPTAQQAPPSAWQQAAPPAAAPPAPRAAAPAPPKARPAPKPKAKPKQDIKVEGGTLVAPMPGTVLDVKVKVGDDVNEGDLILVLEAMKMENEVTAPVSGKIKSIDVEKGATVNAGDPMVIIE